MRRWSEGDDTTTGWIVLRSAIAATVASLIVVGGLVAAARGSHNNMNAGVVAGIALALLPAGVYCFAVKTKHSIILAGVILFGVTGPAWGMFLVAHRSTAFSGVFIIPAFFITLLSSGIAASRDQTPR
jgi:hypothetical protein